MTDFNDPEARPLLSSDASRAQSPASPTSTGSKNTTTTSVADGSISSNDFKPSREVEDDVLPETSALGRSLSWSSCFIIVMSRVIGSGIFATPGAIVQAVGSPGLSLVVWLAGTVIAACGLMVSLEYGCMLPRSGGDKVYLEFTYRHPRFLATTLVTIQSVLLYFTASNCVIFSRYVLFALGRDDASDFLRKGLAAALLLAITIVHVVFPKVGIKVQNVLGWLKIVVIVFMILSSLYAIAFQNDTDEARRTRRQLDWDQLWNDSVWNWGVISTSFFKVFYSYAGLDNITNVLNEVKDPVRTLRSVGFTALVTTSAMYFLINVAYFLVVPLAAIKGSGDLIAALFFEQIFGERVGRGILPFAVALSAVGNVMVVAFAMARLKQEIARQGFLPFSEILSTTRPFGSPIGGFAVHFIPSLLVIVLPPSDSIYSFILELEGYPGQFMSFAIAFGLVWLRVKRPDLKRPFKAWLPGAFLKMGMSAALLAAPFFPPPEKPKNGLFYATYAIVGTLILLTGVIYWYIWTIALPRWRGYRLEEETEVLKDGTSITKLVHKDL